MLHVPPFSQEKECRLSTEPSLQSISERLTALRERSRVDVPESPQSLRKLSTTTTTQHLQDAKPSRQQDNLQKPATEANRIESAKVPKVITEKFSPYCLEPKEYIPEKKPELHRTSSQRSDKQPEPRELRELQRASSVRCSAKRDRGACVGMEPLEINWSVRQLKTLFQVMHLNLIT